MLVVIIMRYVVISCVYFFFFKQKTAYEMRISDWSSDVCSSDLILAVRARRLCLEQEFEPGIRPLCSNCNDGPAKSSSRSELSPGPGQHDDDAGDDARRFAEAVHGRSR